MIFDRTLEDVNNSKKIREEKVKKGIALSQEEVDVLEKGFITIATLNRIESKQQDLKKTFNEMGYYGTQITNKSWSMSGYFLQSDLNRIVKNNDILKNAYFIFSSTPTNAGSKAYFEDLNKIEKMLYDLEIMADDMKKYFKICGTFQCGG